MMHRQLSILINLAKQEDAVAQKKLENDLVLFVRPLEGVNLFLVGLGYASQHAFKVRSEDVLRKRSRNMQRFGLWLPSVFADGSWYLLRRFGASQPAPSSDDLMAAQELLF